MPPFPPSAYATETECNLEILSRDLWELTATLTLFYSEPTVKIFQSTMYWNVKGAPTTINNNLQTKLQTGYITFIVTNGKLVFVNSCHWFLCSQYSSADNRTRNYRTVCTTAAATIVSNVATQSVKPINEFNSTLKVASPPGLLYIGGGEGPLLTACECANISVIFVV